MQRGLLFVLGSTTAGIWLASAGLVRFERSFVVMHAGPCSFCGKTGHEIQLLVGVSGRAPRICDECLGMCLDIIDEERQLARIPLAQLRSEQERLWAAELTERRTQFEAECQHLEPLSGPEREDHRRALVEAALAAPCAEPAPVIDHFRCSFCDAARPEVLKLVSGPRVFLCDRCAVEAIGLLAHVLRA
jgi:hypothetical protein